MNLRKSAFLIQLFAISLVHSNAVFSQIPNGNLNSGTTRQLNPTPGNYPLNTPINHVRTWQANAPISNEADLISIYQPNRNVQQSSQYIDGLGRPLQSVVKGITPLGTDLVSPILYDDFGRERFHYLPYAASSSDGSFKFNAFSEQQGFNSNQFPNEQFFYGESKFDASPLNRVIQNMPAGNAWSGNGRGTSMEYQINTAANEVAIWKPQNGSFAIFGGYYEPGSLFRTITIDEQNKKVVEYKDKEDRVVLKKVQLLGTNVEEMSGWLCTFYVYDDFGLLRFVIPPKATEYFISNGNINAIADELCFRYEYDQKNRMINKKVPGAGLVEMVYDQRDRVTLTRDANLTNLYKWIYTKYDGFNRPIETGYLNEGAPRATFQWYADTYYVDFPYYWWSNEKLTQTFYDNYDWLSNISSNLSNTLDENLTNNGYYFNTNYNSWPDYPQPIAKTNLVKGLVTGTMTKVLGSGETLYSVNLYDEKNRVIQTQSINITGGKDILTTQYTFSGKPLRTLLQHQKNGANSQSHTLLTKYSYDDGGRIVSVVKNLSSSINGNTINTGDKTIVSFSYNSLGQLQNKSLGQNPNIGQPLETLVYDYNIRGWLKSINKDFVNNGSSAANLFGQVLSYDHGFNTLDGQGGYFNGNIAGITWRNAGDNAVQRAFGYNYDAANRLLKAEYSQIGGLANNFSSVMGDNGIDPLSAYDANGNIKRMQQWGIKGIGSAKIDDLFYTYADNGNSNKLINVFDYANDAQSKLGDFKTSALYGDKSTTSIDYTYDANGNLKRDRNKDIIDISGADGIEYNYLNLPLNVTFRSASANKGNINYIYDAAGNKLSKIVTEGSSITTTQYISGFEYKNNVLQQIAHEEGRIRFEQATNGTCPAQPDRYVFDYLVKDHLGNTRMVLTEQQESQCYPAASVEDSRYNTEKEYYKI